jgi:anti-anti-sigma factor
MSIVYLHPTGILDAAVGMSLLSRIESELSQDVTAFHLDCSEIDYIDELGLNCLLQALELISETQGRLLIFSINESVRSTFASRGLDVIFDIYP